MRAALFLSLIFVSKSIWAGQAAQAPATVAVSGTVSDSVTSEPLRRVLVSLIGTERDFAFTNASGQFQIEKATPGQYSIFATKPGYFDPDAISPTHPVRSITITASPQPLDLKLKPAASISGHVLNSAGEPVEGASVQCLTASINSGRLSWNPGLAASTSEDGSYEISNLSPGRYRLRLDERRVPAFDLPVHVAGRLPTEVYPLQFYPNAADEAGAQTIRIEPGGHIQADFTVSPVPAFRVSGTVNLRDQYVNLSLENSSGTEAVPPMGQSNGRWSLSAPSGSWKVVANVFGNTQEYAEQSFDLRGNDLSNINLTLQPLPKIRVHISDPEASPSRYVQVTFSSPNRSAFSIAASQDNPESPQGLLPGAYQVSVSVANGSCIDTVTSGNTDLSRDPLIGSPGGTPAPIDVSLRSDCASLTVHAADGTLPASVLLISDNHVIEPAMQEAPAGTSEFANVSPGQYVVYAFSSLDDLEYANPEALREYSGQSVTLAPNEHAEVKIAIAARGGQ